MTMTIRRTARTLGLGLLATGAAALLFISPAEAQTYTRTASMNAFHRADLNSDSYLSAYEMQYLPSHMRSALADADYNGDGYSSRAEARSALVRTYATPVPTYRARRRYVRPNHRYHRYHRRGRTINRRGGRSIHRRGHTINNRRGHTINNRRGRIINRRRGRTINRRRGHTINRRGNATSTRRNLGSRRARR